jgi:hypothetical protein
MARRVCLLLLWVCLGLIAAGCGGSDTEEASPQSSELVDLTDINQLKTAFNEGEGVPRLIVLLSPT